MSLTPTLNKFVIPGSLTGCSDTSYCGGMINQTINPSELNLWRIIRKNEDGTIELVSDNVNSGRVYVYGKAFYLNLVTLLNLVASAYENSEYTIGSRHMGYNGQTGIITDDSKFTLTAPWSASTTNDANEAEGGGDTLYTTDVDLVKKVYGNLIVKKAGSSTVGSYCLASRLFNYWRSDYYGWNARFVDTTGAIVGHNGAIYLNNYGTWKEALNYCDFRPIIILKSGVKASSGTGTIETPWVLN